MIRLSDLISPEISRFTSLKRHANSARWRMLPIGMPPVPVYDRVLLLDAPS